MGQIEASRTVEIEAPVERVYEIAADIGTSDRWQDTMLSVDVLETDAEGRAAVVETLSDAKVKKVRSRLRFSYDPPRGLSWDQEKGETKWLRGAWAFEDLGEQRTRATYSLETDPGRMLGLLLRGPALGLVKDLLTKDPTEGLKREAESG
jgi:uncharacterized membrane protein